MTTGPVLVASDHGGFRLKEAIVRWLTATGVEAVDLGCHSEQSVDYPEYARQVGEGVAAGRAARGILVCGTGIGMSIAANKVAGVRAALVHEPLSARLTRQHNDSNVLCLGGRVLGDELALEIVRVWLETPFEGGRHQRRLDRIAGFEAGPGRKEEGGCRS